MERESSSEPPVKRRAAAAAAAAARPSGKENQAEVGWPGAREDPEKTHSLRQNICFECRKPLSNSRQLINLSGCQQQCWHSECFRCDMCQSHLANETSCHIYRDKIICRTDYARLRRNNLVRCARCRWPVSASDWVRRAADSVYHLACFTCDICSRQFSTGEQFVVQHGSEAKLLCRLHFSSATSAAAAAAAYSSPSSSSQTGAQEPAASNRKSAGSAACPLKAGACDMSAGYSSPDHDDDDAAAAADSFSAEQYLRFLVSGQRPSQQQSAMPLALSAKAAASATLHDSFEHDESQLELELADSGACSSNGSTTGPPMSLGSKSKRVRTTFTEDQLSILQTHFQIDSNPDGQDLERIATITGLSKRVTQVWFQNSRARQKKYLIKRKPVLSINAPTAAAASISSADCQTFGASGSFHQQFNSIIQRINESNGNSAANNKANNNPPGVDSADGRLASNHRQWPLDSGEPEQESGLNFELTEPAGAVSFCTRRTPQDENPKVLNDECSAPQEHRLANSRVCLDKLGSDTADDSSGRNVSAETD